MIFAANWKLNLGPKASKDLLETLKQKIPQDKQSRCFFFPQNLSLSSALQASKGSGFKLGVQNIYSKTSGAFTGENSLESAEELGLNLALIGHSERRSLFKETNEDLNQKMLLIQNSKIQPMLCFGEKLDERESGKTKAVLKEQLHKALKDYDFSKPLYLAYEPVWAIGTGKVASPEMAGEAHAYSREVLRELAGPEVSKSTPILYGGSVKAESAEELSLEEEIDGFLIGGASLKAESFLKVIEAS